MELFKEVLRGLFIIPFTAGRTLQNEEERTENKMDGSLSSSVFLTCLTSIFFVIIGVFTSKDYSILNDHFVIMGIRCFLVLTGITALSMVAVLAYNNRTVWFQTPTREDVDWKLKGKFLWIFGLIVIFDTSLKFATNMQCMLSGNFITYYAVVSFQNVMSIAFFIKQLAFLTYFRHFKMRSCVRTNYGILTVLFVNLCLWFCTIVNESSKESIDLRNETLSNRTYADCEVNSTFNKAYEKLLMFFIPVRIEAALLSTSFLLPMLPYASNNVTFALQLIGRDEFGDVENQPLLQEQSEPSTTFRERHPFLFFAFITLGMFMNIIFIVNTLIFVFVFIDNEQTQLEMFPTWMGILIAYKSVMLVMMFLVIRMFVQTESGECSEVEQRLTVSEYLLIFCNAASAASYTLLILVVIHNYSLETVTTRLFLTRNCLDIVGKFIQTIIIVSFKHVAPRRTSSYIPLRYLYFLLAVGNFLMWCGNSFAGFKLRNLDAYGFANGGLFANNNNLRTFNRFVLTPIIIFYDFHASMDLFEMYTNSRNS
ncbi:hypothetical protein FSP39_024114 [Pinctada imbricata]|uniref:Uncharacterized protein n=1 Tax=Pinctada imbricata TaxID=66713 RepID=A0AA88XGR6_PINIB|nr:hypothetical protein FSP39_024114 [Pinctada imbricata]